MDDLFNVNVAVGRVTPSGVQILGSAFLANDKGHFVTAQHVVGTSDSGLVIILPKYKSYDAYQDAGDRTVNMTPALIESIDRTKDIAILRTPTFSDSRSHPLGSLDDLTVGSEVVIVGYPHCTDGRFIATIQHTIIGAKVLLPSAGTKVKHAVVNTQTRPGQSGSLVYCPKSKKIVGMLVGTYVPEAEGMVMISGINPAELNQTSHVISAEYASRML
ncbi:MAG: serine protease [Pedobacter sp.]|nr:MAG: serine protease [Pedobacter sp.]